jgi:hypothetical protein
MTDNSDSDKKENQIVGASGSAPSKKRSKLKQGSEESNKEESK